MLSIVSSTTSSYQPWLDHFYSPDLSPSWTPLMYTTIIHVGPLWASLLFCISWDIYTSMAMAASFVYLRLYVPQPSWVLYLHIRAPVFLLKNDVSLTQYPFFMPLPHLSPRKERSYDIYRPYDEFLPSHIRGQSVNTKSCPPYIWPSLIKHMCHWPLFISTTLTFIYLKYLS